MNQDTYIVNTICMTFNQMPYIEDAFNGFTMQETSFPFVCTIMDDASTDGEQDVIKKYLQDHFDLDDNSLTCNKETPDYVYVFTRHKTNHNCFFAVYFLKYNHFEAQELRQKKIQYASELLDKTEGDSKNQGRGAATLLLLLHLSLAPINDLIDLNRIMKDIFLQFSYPFS